MLAQTADRIIVKLIVLQDIFAFVVKRYVVFYVYISPLLPQKTRFMALEITSNFFIFPEKCRPAYLP